MKEGSQDRLPEGLLRIQDLIKYGKGCEMINKYNGSCVKTSIIIGYCGEKGCCVDECILNKGR